MPDPDMDAPLRPCTTIDATPNDGYLDNARAGTPDAGANAGTQSMVANLTNCGGPLGNVVGHGAEGDIDTYKATGECITLNNKADWQPYLAELRGQIDTLVLYGCCVGGGAAGAQLLQEMADIIGAPVSAPTGLIYCDDLGNFTLEPGAIWNTVAPAGDEDVEAIAMPPLPPADQDAANDIVAATYTPSVGDPVTGAAALAIAQQVVWKTYTPPMSLGASSSVPGAKPTGQLQVTRRSPNAAGASVTETFTILADRLLALNTSGKNQYYQVTDKFTQLVRANRK